MEAKLNREMAATFLRDLRLASKKSQKEVAQELGIYPQQVVAWEKGREPIPARYVPALSLMFGTGKSCFARAHADDEYNIYIEAVYANTQA